jgi:DNA-binding protein YbaB
MNRFTLPRIGYFGVFLFLFLSGGWSLAQNRTMSTFDASSVQKIILNGDQIFEIEIQTWSKDQILLQTTVDGEYGNAFKVLSKKESDVFKIALGPSGLSSIPDDKRNAHKIITAAITLRVPEGKQIDVASDVGNVRAAGKMKSLQAVLQTGNFSFEGQSDYIKVETVEGNMDLRISSGKVDAQSTNGSVRIDPALKGDATVYLKSIRGNINVEATSKN